MSQKFNYSEVMDIGFKREDKQDILWYTQNGYVLFVVTKKLSETAYMKWDIETHWIELINMNPDDGGIYGRITMKDMEDVKFWHKFFNCLL